MKIDHAYLAVKDMDRAVAFYEKLLGMKVSNRFRDRWADFECEGFYLGLWNPSFDGEEVETGNNVILVLKTDDIEEEWERISAIARDISPIFEVNFIQKYRYFRFMDSEGNILEVAEYERRR